MRPEPPEGTFNPKVVSSILTGPTINMPVFIEISGDPLEAPQPYSKAPWEQSTVTMLSGTSTRRRVSIMSTSGIEPSWRV